MQESKYSIVIFLSLGSVHMHVSVRVCVYVCEQMM